MSKHSRMIESYGRFAAGMINAAMGGPTVAPVETPKCGKHIVWPTTDGKWAMFWCPAIKGHTQLHEDDNHFPAYHDDDIAFMWEQFKMTRDMP